MRVQIKIAPYCIACCSMCSTQLKLHRSAVRAAAAPREQPRGSPHPNFLDDYCKSIRHRPVFLTSSRHGPCVRRKPSTLKVDDPDLSRSASLSVLAAYARTAPSAAL